MIEKINKITNLQVAILLFVVGCIIFATGITDPFIGDDSGQIVNNPTIHSVKNIRQFFDGGTFYVAQGSHLYGAYYRPLMTTTFSLIYSVFGAHSIYFHAVQFLLCIGSAFLLYLFFRYSFKPLLALSLALIFLVHPLNSQNAFAIAYMQDALYFFFGILGIWLLIRFRSVASLLAVALCFFLSLLAKESGILFVVMALLFLLWWDRKRILAFTGMMILPVAAWLVLKAHAVGLHTNPLNAPIDYLNLGDRLLTAPSIVLFYFTKFLFPFHLASGYYWTHPNFSVRYFFIPLAIDLAVVAAGVYVALLIRRRASQAQYRTYLFFAIWALIGLLPYLQIIPLDMTASESWFYFSMAGVLGMIGMASTTLVKPKPVSRAVVIAVVAVALVLLGARTIIRGTDWRSPVKLASHDIVASKQDYNAYNVLAIHSSANGDYDNAIHYAQQSINIFPTDSAYNVLGASYYKENNYNLAIQNYLQGLTLDTYNNDPQLVHQLYDNTARLMIWSGDPAYNRRFMITAINRYPQDADLWLDLAVLDYQHGNVAEAKTAITQTYKLSQNPTAGLIYSRIINNQPLGLSAPTVQ
jgi:Tfp pilus assembly protein PilF